MLTLGERGGETGSARARAVESKSVGMVYGVPIVYSVWKEFLGRLGSLPSFSVGIE